LTASHSLTLTRAPLTHKATTYTRAHTFTCIHHPHANVCNKHKVGKIKTAPLSVRSGLYVICSCCKQQQQQQQVTSKA